MDEHPCARPKTLPKKIVLKISGEVLSASDNETFSKSSLASLIDMVSRLHKNNISLAIVVGGGNLLRGHELERQSGLKRTSSDTIGMHASLLNGIALQGFLTQYKLPSVAFAPLQLIGPRYGDPVSSPILSYEPDIARKFFEEGSILLLAGGTGIPFFTTDTAAVVRALELQADIVIKATKVNGAFSQDPLLDSSAKRYETLSFKEVLKQEIRVMDLTAFSLAKEHNLPLFIYKYGTPPSPLDALKDRAYGTLILPDGSQKSYES